MGHQGQGGGGDVWVLLRGRQGRGGGFAEFVGSPQEDARGKKRAVVEFHTYITPFRPHPPSLNIFTKRQPINIPAM